MTSRILTDEELTTLVSQFADRGPVQLPNGADVDNTLTRLHELGAPLRGVHVAEETERDGIILMA